MLSMLKKNKVKEYEPKEDVEEDDWELWKTSNEKISPIKIVTEETDGEDTKDKKGDWDSWVPDEWKIYLSEEKKLPEKFELSEKDQKFLESGRFERSSVRFQVNFAFDKTMRIGVKRHEAKNECREQGLKTSHDLGQNTGIHNTKTRRNIQNTAEQLLKYCRNKKNFDLKDPNKIKPVRNLLEVTEEHVKQFMYAKSRENYSQDYLKGLSSNLNKFASALNKIDGNKRSWEKSMKEIRKQADKVEHFSRRYEKPLDLIRNLKNPYHKMFATLQYSHGLRVDELNNLKHLETWRDHIITNTKGGRTRGFDIAAGPAWLNPFALLREASQEFLKYEMLKEMEDALKTYRPALKEACEKSGQVWYGTHGLRYNFAQREFWKLQAEQGLTELEARKIVSDRLGHSRLDVLETYMRV